MQLSFRNIDACFPRSTDYRCGHRPFTVNETAATFRHFPYRERHLQCLWADPRHRPAELKTSEGEAVVVEQAGEWNLEAGPDFLNAVLLIGKERRRICGDLEIHIHANAWNQHGHADDPRYYNVRFHIVYFQGVEIPGLIQIPLQEMLVTNPRFSFENIDPTAYPYSIPVGNFPLLDMHPDEKIRFLEAAGEERLRLKAERFAFAMQNKEPDQLLWEELMAALGYKNNKAPFRQLAATLPLTRLQSLTRTPGEAYALLLGLSGLLPANPDPEWDPETRQFIRAIWDFWWRQSEKLKDLTLDRSDWTLAGIRPVNHPVRRLMAAAHYAFRIADLADNPSILTDGPDNFWNTHISWKTKCTPIALVGQARANAMITNILIPFRAAIGAVELDLENLPVEPTNSIIRQTAHALFGPDHTQKVYRSALARQGLIQIFHDYLITHRLDELKTKYGGALASMSALPNAGQRGRCPSTQPEPNTGGTLSSMSIPSSVGDGDIAPPTNSDTQTGGTTSPLSADDGEIVPPSRKPEYPNRKHPAHHPPIEQVNRAPIIFLTVCTHKRQKILANDTMHEALKTAWRTAGDWIVGRYIMMPDHIHLFCSPATKESVNIAQWVSYWKRLVSQQLKNNQRIWQRDCWDIQLRNHETYSAKWSYVKNNPVRAGLTENPDAWIYQGTLNHLPW